LLSLRSFRTNRAKPLRGAKIHVKQMLETRCTGGQKTCRLLNRIIKDKKVYKIQEIIKSNT